MSKAIDYCIDVFDGTHESPKPTNYGYKLITSKNIMSGYLDFTDSYFISKEDYEKINLRSKVNKWDVLFSMIGTVGNVCLIEEDSIDFAIKNMGVFSCDCKNKAIWLYYYLQSPYIKKLEENYLNGAIQKFLPLNWLRKLEIPDLDTHKERISDILYSIDAQIKRNNAMVQKLQVLAHAIFNRFFYSENNSISLVDFPYIQVIKPGIIKFENKKHYIATAEIEGEQFNYNAPLIEYETRENRANMQPISNSVWFAKMKNSIKHIYVTQNDKRINQSYIFSTGFCGIECEEFAFEYMVNYLNLSYFEMKKNITSHGATMEGINNEDLKLFKIHLPAKDKLILFHNKTKEIYYEISRIRQATFQLTCLKNKLLPLLFNEQLK